MESPPSPKEDYQLRLETINELNETFGKVVEGEEFESSEHIKQIPGVSEFVLRVRELSDKNNEKDQIISQLSAEVSELKLQGSRKREEEEKLKEAEIIEERYEEVLSELVEYESLNKRLEEEVGRLSEEVNHYKIQVEEFSKQLLDSSNSQNSMDPLDLKKKVDSVELKRLIKKDEAEGDQFLTSCLLKIVTLENNVNEIQSEIDHNNLYLENFMARLGSDKAHNLRGKITDIENYLKETDKELNKSYERTDSVIEQLRE